MKKFELRSNFQKEEIERAILRACYHSKQGDISIEAERGNIIVYDHIEGREPKYMALLKEVAPSEGFRDSYVVNIWGNSDNDEKIMNAFLENLNITEEDIEYA